MSDVRAAVDAHVEAFNARDAEAVVSQFAPDGEFSAGGDVAIGHRELFALFADAFSQPVHARLTVASVVVDGDTAAAELVERLDYEGTSFEVTFAAFYTVRAGLLARVRVYREMA